MKRKPTVWIVTDNAGWPSGVSRKWNRNGQCEIWVWVRKGDENLPARIARLLNEYEKRKGQHEQ